MQQTAIDKTAALDAESVSLHIQSNLPSEKSDGELLAQQLNAVRSALLKSGGRATSAYDRRRNRGNEFFNRRESAAARDRAPSAQQLFFGSSAASPYSDSRSDRLKADSRRSTIHVEPVTSFALPTSISQLSGVSSHEFSGNVSLSSYNQPSATGNILSSPRKSQRDAFDHRLYYEPLSPKFALAPVNSHARKTPDSNQGDSKAVLVKCDSLMNRLRQPANRVLPSNYGQIFGGSRKRLVTLTATATAPNQQSDNAQTGAAQPSSDAKNSRVTVVEDDDRGTYFTLGSTGQSERRAIKPSTRVQVGRNGQAVSGDEQLTYMLGSSALLSNERTTLHDALDSMKLEERGKSRQKLSWKDELSDPNGKLFDLRKLDQRKEAAKLQMEAEQFQNSVHLDLQAAAQLIGVTSHLIYPIIHDASTHWKPVDTTAAFSEPLVGLAIRKPDGERRLASARPSKTTTRPRAVQSAVAKLESCGPSNRPLSTETPNRPKSHRNRQTAAETRPLPNLNLTSDQWQTFALRPGPAIDLASTNTAFENRRNSLSGRRRNDSTLTQASEMQASIPSYRQMQSIDDMMHITPYSEQQTAHGNTRASSGRLTRSSLKSALSGTFSGSRPKSTGSLAGSSTSYVSIVQGCGICVTPRATSARQQRLAKATAKAKVAAKPSELADMVAAVASQRVVIPQPGLESVLSDANSMRLPSNATEIITDEDYSKPKVNLYNTPVEHYQLGSGELPISSMTMQSTDINYFPGPPVSVRSDGEDDLADGIPLKPALHTHSATKSARRLHWQDEMVAELDQRETQVEAAVPAQAVDELVQVASVVDVLGSDPIELQTVTEVEPEPEPESDFESESVVYEAEGQVSRDANASMARATAAEALEAAVVEVKAEMEAETDTEGSSRQVRISIPAAEYEQEYEASNLVDS